MSDMSQTMGRFGRMDLDRWISLGYVGRYRVLLNDGDITYKCRWFDDHEGRAECLKEPIEIDIDGGADVEYLHGKITVVPVEGK